MRLFSKILMLFFIFCFFQNSITAQEFYQIPKQVFDLYEMTGVKANHIDTVNAFEISQFITLKEYKQFLEDVKADSSKQYYLQMLPDSSIAKTKDVYEKYLNSKKYEKNPVLGVSWDAAVEFCKWKTQKNASSEDFYYSLPLASEWLAAYRYLNKNPIKNDFNYKYSDLLLTSVDEMRFALDLNNSNDYEFIFDNVNFHKKDEPRMNRRKRIAGGNYLFEQQTFFNDNYCLFSDKGSEYVSFRIVKVSKNQQNRGISYNQQ